MNESEVNRLIDFQLFLFKKELINNYSWDFEKEAELFLEQFKPKRISIEDFVKSQYLSERTKNFLKFQFPEGNIHNIYYMNQLTIPFIKQLRGAGAKTIWELSQVWDFENKTLK